MKRRGCINILFVAYISVLLRITVFRSTIGSCGLFCGEINLIPCVGLFRTFQRSLASFVCLFGGNIIWFVPFGLYVRGFKKYTCSRSVVLGFCLSLFIETAQYVLGTGISDIDDLALNTLGVFLGVLAANRLKGNFNFLKAVRSVFLTAVFSAVLFAAWVFMFWAAVYLCNEIPFWSLSSPQLARFLFLIFIVFNVSALVIFKRKPNKPWEYPLTLIAASSVMFLCMLAVLDLGCMYFDYCPG